MHPRLTSPTGVVVFESILGWCTLDALAPCLYRSSELRKWNLRYVEPHSFDSLENIFTRTIPPNNSIHTPSRELTILVTEEQGRRSAQRSPRSSQRTWHRYIDTMVIFSTCNLAAREANWESRQMHTWVSIVVVARNVTPTWRSPDPATYPCPLTAALAHHQRGP
jgi:hypothetical protein